MKIVLNFFIAVFIVACGYVPTSKLADNIFDEKVYVNVELSPQDPKNSIFVADTLKEMVISKLGRKLALKHEADDIINVGMNNLEFIPLIYDKNGYVIKYKAKLNLNFHVVFKDGSEENFSTSGSYNFDISPNSIISDSARQMAIREASKEAFDEFISVIAIRGSKHNDKYQ
ncbi:LPS assembly lipoprotein LptE [Campylobacter helveticus]|uniref:Lipooligosaccharide transport system, OM component (LptE family) n=1 Tax=Campylobacter helveticus TaxID=28898 RepID=A0AAX2UJ42_9BACT|nr:LPS assembly lipoprotein LptE [Campylobacter helveticus]ARE80879.1 putative lipooligosaccharide transport system, OM component (LptE family) [Campylobacter helveticus]MCR2039690.1 LPS assembly lipoprotein LptE [Campylobacter helveticus]MCR2054892.1 LPS assembly lipoprotein LptE [Campylobacter helveticus]MCR2056586.1 LPS assembly lipoprotein LptE [Campylobacter helveticus]MCR2062210.1 LPS assembly lipoprotein LptE [Campylobacter helveticus]